MNISRRAFLTSTTAAALATAVPIQTWAAHPVGEASLLTLSDGFLSVPPSTISNADTKDVVALRGNSSASNNERPCNIAVWKDGARTVVFDVGAGPNFMPSAGKLLDSLAAADIEVDVVTDVLFTHAHPDHLWGVLDDFDEPLFPNARYQIAAQEKAWWLDPDTLQSLPENRKVFAAAASRLINALGDQLETFTPGTEVVPGIEAIATPGHTPGHTAFALHSGSENAVVLGDAILDDVISFARPLWELQNDADPRQAAQTRVALLDRLTTEKSLFAGFHLAQGGLGYAVKAAENYRLERA